MCSRPNDLAYVLEHLPELVVKAVGESGGYGMLIGPASDEEKIEGSGRRSRPIRATYIAQPVVGLSRVPSYDVAIEAHGRAARGPAALLPV